MNLLLKVITAFLSLSVVLAATPLVAQTNAVEPPCSLATLKGTFGVLEHGTFLVPFPGVLLTPPFPVVLSANPTYDGKGNFSGAFAANVGGSPVSGTFTGIYTVGRDCTYSDSFTTSVGTVGNHTGTINGRGMFQEIDYIYTDPILVVTGRAKKAPPSGCSSKHIKGTYSSVEEGTWYIFPVPLSFAAESSGTYDGAGNFSGTAVANVAGMVSPGGFTGTYTVGPECSFSSEYTTSLGISHTAGTITGQGMFQEIPYIYIDPGIVAFGTIKKR